MVLRTATQTEATSPFPILGSFSPYRPSEPEKMKKSKAELTPHSDQLAPGACGGLHIFPRNDGSLTVEDYHTVLFLDCEFQHHKILVLRSFFFFLPDSFDIWQFEFFNCEMYWGLFLWDRTSDHHVPTFDRLLLVQRHYGTGHSFGERDSPLESVWPSGTGLTQLSHGGWPNGSFLLVPEYLGLPTR